ncbi:VTT domain-containing protein [Clostridium sp.]|uniref:TVP38/TMEM64 family protein n=1 Tax=Clostridium sp. TaxID=1506 RepID=UPI002FC76F45
MCKHSNKLKSYLMLVVTIVGFIGIFMYMKSQGILEHMASAEAFKNYIESYGKNAYIIFFIIQFISVIVAPIPSNISAVVGGTIFGMWESFFISMVAIISGSVVVFILARKLGRPFTERFVSPKVSSKYEEHISSKKGEILLVLLLFLPFFPDDAVGFLVGLSKMKLGKYFIIMLLTRPWEILAASALGSSNIVIPLWGWGIITLLIIYIIKNSTKIEEKLLSVVKG